MSTPQIVLVAFAVLILGIVLPVPSGVRSALVLALIALSVLTFIGGGMQYVIHLFD